jgi:hypothetical protein
MFSRTKQNVLVLWIYFFLVDRKNFNVLKYAVLIWFLLFSSYILYRN